MNRMGWDINIILLPYGDLWKKHRKIFHQEYRLEAMEDFREDQQRAVVDLLRNLSETPERWITHLRLYVTSSQCSVPHLQFSFVRYPAAITMHKSYGHWVGNDDPIVDTTEQAGNMLKLCIFPGAVLANVFPSCTSRRHGRTSGLIVKFTSAIPSRLVSWHWFQGLRVQMQSFSQQNADDSLRHGQGEDGTCLR